MGPDGDGGAVVDQRGRVRGIDGLAVVDASIMPNVPAPTRISPAS
jgi:choline dehydrogenase